MNNLIVIGKITYKGTDIWICKDHLTDKYTWHLVNGDNHAYTSDPSFISFPDNKKVQKQAA